MRLIDADALMDNVYESHHENPHTLAKDRAMHTHEHNLFLIMISHAPTIDAVSVVRCKECKTYSNGTCWIMRGKMKPDDFCSYGERRSDD